MNEFTYETAPSSRTLNSSFFLAYYGKSLPPCLVEKSESDRSNSVALAGWLVRTAKRRGISAAKLADGMGVHQTYFSQIKRGKIARIPIEKLQAAASVLEIQMEEVFEGAGVAPPRTTLWFPPQPTVPLYDEKPKRVQLVYTHGIPDHAWPILAERKGYFSDANIEIDLIPAPLSAYPRFHKELARAAHCTAFVMPLLSLSVPEFENVTPCAWTHNYVGFPVIGRFPSKLTRLPDFPTMDSFGELMRKLVDRKVIEQKAIAFIEKPEQEFFKAVCEFARLRLKLDFPVAGSEFGAIPSERSETFLEELYEIGDRRYDLTVAHALSLAVALKHNSHYSDIFDYTRINRLVSSAVTDQSPPAEQEIATRIRSFRMPVVLALNTPGSAEPRQDREIIFRLCAVAYRAVDEILRHLSEGAAAQILERIGPPESDLVNESVDVPSFIKAWQSCYAFRSFDEELPDLKTVLGPSLLIKRLFGVLREFRELKEEALNKLAKCEDYFRKDRPSGKWAQGKQLYLRARRHFELSNFYDANEFATKAIALTKP